MIMVSDCTDRVYNECCMHSTAAAGRCDSYSLSKFAAAKEHETETMPRMAVICHQRIMFGCDVCISQHNQGLSTTSVELCRFLCQHKTLHEHVESTRVIIQEPKWGIKMQVWFLCGLHDHHLPSFVRHSV